MPQHKIHYSYVYLGFFLFSVSKTWAQEMDLHSIAIPSSSLEKPTVELWRVYQNEPIDFKEIKEINHEKIPVDAIVMNHQDLHQQPEQLQILLWQALNTHNIDLIKDLLSIYEKNASPHDALKKRAQAHIWRLQGKNKQAIELYEQLLKEEPNHIRNRLDLGAVQLEDNRLGDAQKTFQIAQTTTKLPENVEKKIHLFQSFIHHQTRWQFSGSVSPIRHNNVNNVAISHCIQGIYCSNEKPEKAYGLAYEWSVEKRTPIRRNHAWLIQANLNGNNYFLSKKSQYDDVTVRLAMGWQWQNHRRSMSVLPFYQIQGAGSHEFVNKKVNNKRLMPFVLAHSVGASVQFSQIYSNDWQSRHSFERSKIFYREEASARRNNGFHDQMQHMLIWRVSPQTHFFTAYQYNRFVPSNKLLNHRENFRAFQRHAIHLGWSQSWKKSGFQSRINMSYAKRNYRGIAPFGREAQRNREWGFSVTLGHEKWVWRGFKPNLNIQINQINSNQIWAKRRSKQIFVRLEKSF